MNEEANHNVALYCSSVSELLEKSTGMNTDSIPKVIYVNLESPIDPKNLMAVLIVLAKNISDRASLPPANFIHLGDPEDCSCRYSTMFNKENKIIQDKYLISW